MGEKEEKGGGSEGKESNTSPEITVEVDGESKTYGAEDVKNLLAQQASATQKTQEVAALVDAAEKYGLDPEDYVGRAEGAFATIVSLMDDKVLDKEGKRIPTKEEDADKDRVLLKKEGEVESKELDAKVSEALDEINKRTRRLEEDNLSLIRKGISKEVREKHPELNEDDVSRLFGIAMANQKKNVWQHAEEFVKKKKEGKASLRAEYAKEFGVNLKQWDENKVNEQDAKGGGAAAILGEKKISFKKGAKGAVTPKQATLEYFRKIDKAG